VYLKKQQLKKPAAGDIYLHPATTSTFLVTLIPNSVGAKKSGFSENCPELGNTVIEPGFSASDRNGETGEFVYMNSCL
jgi:hypothetical protein